MNDNPIEGPQGCHFGVECNKAGFCKLGQVTGITCPNDSCDIEDGIRSLPVSAAIKGFGPSPVVAALPVYQQVKAIQDASAPKCKTCNDTGSVPALVETATGYARCPYLGEPCPDCQ